MKKISIDRELFDQYYTAGLADSMVSRAEIESALPRQKRGVLIH
jgi:hypothetical protein